MSVIMSSSGGASGGGGGGGPGHYHHFVPPQYTPRSRNSSIIPNSESFSTTDPSKLSDHELDCLKEAFSLFDADHDGEITVGELGRVMRNHGLNPTEEELADMIRNVDKNSNGAIDFNEFIEMMLRRDSKVEEDVVHAFRVFDRDGDGLISEEELRLTMNNLGEPLTDQEVRSMIEEADLDGDGRINFQEFARLMQSHAGIGGGGGGGGGAAGGGGGAIAGPSSSSSLSKQNGRDPKRY